jgi:hypothetical protein
MVNSLLLSFSGFKVSLKSKEGYIPWADSDQLKAARRVLKDMYDSYPEGHPVKLFLQKRAIHNLTQPSGHTNIPYSFFDIN